MAFPAPFNQTLRDRDLVCNQTLRGRKDTCLPSRTPSPLRSRQYDVGKIPKEVQQTTNGLHVHLGQPHPRAADCSTPRDSVAPDPSGNPKCGTGTKGCDRNGKAKPGQIIRVSDYLDDGPWESSAEVSEETSEKEGCFSLGSRGHPLTCAAGCKYFWKVRGCKDGSACSRCHLCTWSRGKERSLARAKVREQTL